MTDDSSAQGPNGIDRRQLLALLLAGNSVSADEQQHDPLCNNLLWAVAWKQTAAEYLALCHQAYNLARLRVDMAIAGTRANDKPLAVITDVDDTILHAGSYWGYLIRQNRDFFDDSIWDAWLPNNQVTPAPGALSFFRYCHERNIEVFYVTSRDQGERTFEYALSQLRALKFPFADESHLYVFRDTSDKTPARLEIEKRFRLAVMLGDNLNDFRRDYYVKDVDERRALMERDHDRWGSEFILLPNPTDGHWVRAIFGDSEPAPTDANRRLLRQAAMRVAWDGGNP